MKIQDHHAYQQLVTEIKVANGYDQEQAEWALESAMIDIEEGAASYASAAADLGLVVDLTGTCGFDSADLLSMIC